MRKLQRPKPGETDEDLIRQNEEFLRQMKLQDKNDTTTAAIRTVPDAATSGSAQKRPTIEEILQQYHISPEKSEAEGPNYGKPVPDPVYEELDVSAGRSRKKEHFPFLEIRERGPETACFPAPAPKPQTRKKVSQFARSRAKEGSAVPEYESQSSTIAESQRSQAPIGGSIHPLLEGMTEAEILQEQKKLIQKMDPKLVEFVRSMKHQHKKPPSSSAPAESAPPIKQSKTEEPQISTEDLPINPDDVKQMPHMDKMEPSKLLWTLPPKSNSSKTVEKRPEERNARFDFQGRLITEDEEKDPKTWLKGLHHHGEEMQRPGYTLDELLTLARSTNAGQRAASLDMYAEILRNGHDGMFDFMLGKSVFDLCTEMDWIYVVRKGVDNNDALTINAALNCFSGLLYPEREEICLDTILIWHDSEIGPCIVPEIEDTTDLFDKLQSKRANEEEPDDKDFQVARADLIEFLIHRGCLLERFEYLLSSKSDYLTSFGLINMLKILIRIGRHSPEHLVKNQKILDYFVSHHLQLNTNSVSESKRIQKMEGVPSLLFLKLLRILISSSKQNAFAVMQKYEAPIFTSIELNLSCSDTLLHVMPQIELLIQQSILLWMYSVGAGCGVDRFFAFAPITLKFFNLYLAKPLLNTFDLNHSSLMIALLLKCLRSLHGSTLEQCVRQYSQLIEQLAVKTVAILGASHLEDQIDLDASLGVLHQCLEFFMFANSANHYQPQVVAKIDQLLCTPAFEKTTKRITHSGLLLCKTTKIEENFEQRYPNNLVFTEAVLFGGKLCPLLREGHFAIMFLAAFHRCAKLVTLKNAKFLHNNNVREYLQKLIAAQSYYNEENYYMRFELLYLREVLETIDMSEDRSQEFRAQLSYKLCSVPRIGNEELSKSFLNLFLNTYGQQMPHEEMTNLLNLYGQMINLGKSSCSKSANQFRKWRTELLPFGWLTEPLKAVHSTLGALQMPKTLEPTDEEMESESDRQAEELKLKNAVLSYRIIVWRVLRFMRLCLSTNSLQNVVVQTKLQFVDFYTKVCQVFLMSPTIFLYQPVCDCMLDIFQYFCNHKILSASKKSDVFSKQDAGTNEMVGTPFETFYSQLVTEFSNSSYGDEVFSAYILLPLRTQESKKIKLRFWTDVCIRFVRLQKQNDMLPLSYFIGSPANPVPHETDPEIIRIYETLLKVGTCSEQRNPFLSEIAKFHLQL